MTTKTKTPPKSRSRTLRRISEIDLIVTRLAMGLTNQRGEPINTGVRFMTLFTEAIFPKHVEPGDFSNATVSKRLAGILKIMYAYARNTEGWDENDLHQIFEENPRKPTVKQKKGNAPNSS